MSSSDRRRVFLALAALPLAAACGFAPVHAPGGGGGALRGRILADAPVDARGFAFVARIEDRLGRATAPAFALGYSLDVEQTGTGVTMANVTTRYVLEGRLLWSLRPAGGGDPTMAGELRSFTAYSATSTTVATLTARDDAERRLMVILADRLVAELYARAAELGEAGP